MTTPSQDPGSGQSLFSVDEGEQTSCTICGEPVVAGASALCSACGEPYHLVLTNDAEGKNCGEVWLNEEFLALEFGCARCLASMREVESAEPPAPAPRESQRPVRVEPSGESGRVRHAGTSAREIVRRKRR